MHPRPRRSQPPPGIAPCTELPVRQRWVLTSPAATAAAPPWRRRRHKPARRRLSCMHRGRHSGGPQCAARGCSEEQEHRRRAAGPYPAAGARPRRAARAAAILGTASEGSGAGSIATARQEGPAAPEALAPPRLGGGRLPVRVSPSQPRDRDRLWDSCASLRLYGTHISAVPREGPRFSRGGAVMGARRMLPPPPCPRGGAVRRCLRPLAAGAAVPAAARSHSAGRQERRKM